MKKQLLFALVILVVVACSNNSGHTSSPIPFFPKQKEEPNVYMQADLTGELILVDGCLRINDIDNNNFLLVWPKDFSLRIENNTVQVIDEIGQLVAQEGDTLVIGGGEMPEEHIAEYLAEPLPDNCRGPFWIVGDEFQ